MERDEEEDLPAVGGATFDEVSQGGQDKEEPAPRSQTGSRRKASKPPAGAKVKAPATPKVHPVRMVFVTPDQARLWLESPAGRDRALSSDRIKKLVEVMERGDWVPDMTPIRFRADGKRVDGQHRLHALIRYGQPLWMMLSENWTDDEADYIDMISKERTPSDVLAMRGQKHSREVAALTSALAVLKTGTLPQRYPRLAGHVVREIVEKDSDIPLCVDIGARVNRGCKPARRLSVSLAVYQIRGACRENSDGNFTDADRFIALFETGAELDGKHPVLALRRRLMAQPRVNTDTAMFEQYMLILLAWNAFREARELQILKVPAGITPANVRAY